MNLFIDCHSFYHAVDIAADGGCIGVEVMRLGGVESEQLAYQHVCHDAVDIALGRAVRHRHHKVGLHALQLRLLAGNDDNLCHRRIVGIHLTNQITLVALGLLFFGHEIDHDRLAVDHSFRTMTETEERIKLADYRTVGELLAYFEELQA